jgi:hypothetical protein
VPAEDAERGGDNSDAEWTHEGSGDTAAVASRTVQVPCKAWAGLRSNLLVGAYRLLDSDRRNPNCLLETAS